MAAERKVLKVVPDSRKVAKVVPYEREEGSPLSYLAKGLKEGASRDIGQSWRGLSGGESLPELPESENLPQSIGRGISHLGTGLAESYITSRIPGLGGLGVVPALKRTGAMGAIGALTTPGDYRQRLSGGAMNALANTLFEGGNAIAHPLQTLESIMQSGKNIYRKVNPKINELEDVRKQQYENRLRQSGQEDLPTQSNNIFNQYANEHRMSLAEQQQAAHENVLQHFPELSTADTNKALQEQTEQHVKKLYADLGARYNAFGNTEAGQSKIKEPFSFEDIESHLKGAKRITKSAARKVSTNTSEKESPYAPFSTETLEITHPPKNGTVNDYITFMRQTRDNALLASKNAKQAPTELERKRWLDTADRLRKLQTATEKKMKDTIPENYNEFQEIQNDYKNKYAQPLESPAIRKAAYDKTISSGLHAALNQPKAAGLREHLYEQPSYVQALKQHLLQEGKHPLRTNNIDQDVRALLSPNELMALHQHENAGNQIRNFEELIRSVKQPKNLYLGQIEDYKQYSPAVKNFIEAQATQQTTAKNLKKEAERLKISEKELKEAIHKRKLQLIAGGSVASALGAPKAYYMTKGLVNLSDNND